MSMTVVDGENRILNLEEIMDKHCKPSRDCGMINNFKNRKSFAILAAEELLYDKCTIEKLLAAETEAELNKIMRNARIQQL